MVKLTKSLQPKKSKYRKYLIQGWADTSTYHNKHLSTITNKWFKWHSSATSA